MYNRKYNEKMLKGLIHRDKLIKNIRPNLEHPSQNEKITDLHSLVDKKYKYINECNVALDAYIIGM